jgi:predicted lipid-binding transport protein (Tim44 family)
VTAIIIFALAAAFLGFRLYGVLGDRTGHEQSLPRAEDAPAALSPEAKPASDARDGGILPRQQPNLAEDGAMAGIRAIAAADRQFSLGDFVEGAQSAYRLILEGYWQGRIDDIVPYISDDVRQAFTEAAAARAEAGEVLDNRLVTIERAIITDASQTAGVAQISVQFDADIASVTRDRDGNVIAGSLTDAIPTHDIWTFSRDIRSSDPNWVLIDTDEA